MSARAVFSPFALGALLIVSVPTMALAAPDLANVRELYAAASYAEALEVLGGVQGADNTEVVEQYRALCLLALGRNADAEQALERIVLRRPLYMVPAGEVSPRLVTMYRDVRRRRSLPGATRQAYARAKASYDAKDHKAAAEQFKDVLTLMNDPDAAGQGSTLTELKQLAEGFLALSEAALVAAAPPPPPPTPAPAPAPVSEPVKAASAPLASTPRPMPMWSRRSRSIAPCRAGDRRVR